MNHHETFEPSITNQPAPVDPRPKPPPPPPNETTTRGPAPPKANDSAATIDDLQQVIEKVIGWMEVNNDRMAAMEARMNFLEHNRIVDNIVRPPIEVKGSVK